VAPPFEAGALKLRVAVVELVAVAVPIVGAPGTVGAVAAIVNVVVDAPLILFAVTV
jgi:hypothetical protein